MKKIFKHISTNNLNMTGKKHIVAYKIPNINRVQSFNPSTQIQVCPCGKNLFVIVGRYRKSKDTLCIYPKRYELARIYQNYDFGVFSMKNELEKNGSCCACDGKYLDLDFIHQPEVKEVKEQSKQKTKSTNYFKIISNKNGRTVIDESNMCSQQNTRPQQNTKKTKPKLTVEQKLEMSLDDIILYNQTL